MMFARNSGADRRRKLSGSAMWQMETLCPESWNRRNFSSFTSSPPFFFHFDVYTGVLPVWYICTWLYNLWLSLIHSKINININSLVLMYLKSLLSLSLSPSLSLGYSSQLLINSLLIPLQDALKFVLLCKSQYNVIRKLNKSDKSHC